MKRIALITLCAMLLGGGMAYGAPQFVRWGGEIAWPRLAPHAAVPSFTTNLTVNDAGDNSSLTFVVPKTGSLTHIGFRVGTVTSGEEMLVEVHSVNEGFYKSGTRLHAADTGVVNVATANLYYWVSLDSLGDAPTVTQGDWISTVVRKDGSSGGAINLVVNQGIQAMAPLPYTPRMYDSTTVLTARSGILSTMAIKIDGIGVPIGSVPAESIGTQVIIDSTTQHALNPDEAGIIVKPKFPAIVSGFSIAANRYFAGSLSSNTMPSINMRFYNGTTLYDSNTVAADSVEATATATGLRQIYFNKPCTLSVGGTYRFTCANVTRDLDSDTGLIIPYMTVHDSTTWYCTDAGPEMYWTMRSDGDAFTDYWNRRPFMSLLITQLSADAGDSGRRRIMMLKTNALVIDAVGTFAGGRNWDEIPR